MTATQSPTYDPANIFARILRGELPCEKVYEDDATLAIMDIMPQADGHVLVIPKAPSADLLDADPATLGRLFAAVQKVGAAVRTALAADGITVMQFNGAAAGQTVFHLHVHIVPRQAGVALRPHTGAMEKPEVLKAHADRIRRALGA